MALNYDLRACADIETLRDDQHWAVTESLIFATIAVHMHGITEKNWKEFYIRLNMLEQAVGPMCREKEYITPEEVRARIGLECNVADSKVKFNSAIVATLRRDAARRLQKALIHKVEKKSHEEGK